ncbi:hypothetical protein HN51_054632 [Arachis hypogaea]|uniref:Knottin scorpion toxin-like domain-containing protein n=1 Tax=Arachis hypogaea TaxID=3818 RepID=A0A6B9VAF8_ARAHY|nr:uncharacterized protein DS421_19g650830 [Arachis hypogaea]
MAINGYTKIFLCNLLVALLLASEARICTMAARTMYKKQTMQCFEEATKAYCPNNDDGCYQYCRRMKYFTGHCINTPAASGCCCLTDP